MKLTGKTRVLGIFGDPVSHSMSPLMQNAALAEAGIDAVYVPFHVVPNQLNEAVSAIRTLGLWGVNVTVPHKESILEMLDEVAPQARLVGAVNTVVNQGGRLIGYNTDAQGFLQSLMTDLGVSPEGKKVLLIGAGGACRAAIVALGGTGVQSLTIANRTIARASRLVEEFRVVYPGTDFAYCSLGDVGLDVLDGIDLVVNTSSMGLKGELIPDFPWSALPAKVPVYDMIYGRQETPFLSEANSRGHRVANGLGMLVAQGEAAFVLWTGQTPPSGVMAASILTEFGKI